MGATAHKRCTLPLTSIDQVLDELPDAPIETTRGRGWSGITLDIHGRTSPYAYSASARDHHVVGYCWSGRGHLIQRRAGEAHNGIISTGMSFLLPAGCPSAWEGDIACTARLRVPTELIAQAAVETGARVQTRFEMLNVFQARDPTIEMLSRVLMGELYRPPHPIQALIAEATSCALVAHLLRDYNAYGAPQPPALPMMSNRALASIETYIDDHIGQQITLAELAAVANVSRFYFTRIFKRSTGLTAMAYLERSRIQKAQDLLTRRDLPLSEIALMLGFADQSHFTRRFHRLVGYTPGAYARCFGTRRRPVGAHPEKS